MLVYLCRCNNCENIYIDPNPQVDAPLHEVKKAQYRPLKFGEDAAAWICPLCKTDGYLTDM